MSKASDIHGIDRGQPVRFRFDGRELTACTGESVAAALLRAGIVATRCTTHRGEARGYYCGMGVCWECAVEVEGVGVVRACQQTVSEGAVLHTAHVPYAAKPKP